jgi:hypothetical protein
LVGRNTGQELLGHADVKTTMIYTHVLNRGGLGVQSPPDLIPLDSDKAVKDCRDIWRGVVWGATHFLVGRASERRRGDLLQRSTAAKGILVAVGVLFVVSGLVITTLRLARVIAPGYGWLAPIFFALGVVGTLTAWFGLRDGRRWPLVPLGLLYVPWTIIGLVGDVKQGYWPLVAGESLGLVLVAWAIITIMRRAV